jgi:hypothetical protein
MPMPRIKYFVQCDEVKNENGKFSAIGIFDTIFASSFPAVHRQFFLMLGLLGAEGVFDVECLIISPEGRTIANSKGQLKLDSPQSVGNVAFGFMNFLLPQPGKYKISVFLDGDFLADHFFQVFGVQRQRQGPMPHPPGNPPERDPNA